MISKFTINTNTNPYKPTITATDSGVVLPYPFGVVVYSTETLEVKFVGDNVPTANAEVKLCATYGRIGVAVSLPFVYDAEDDVWNGSIDWNSDTLRGAIANKEGVLLTGGFVVVEKSLNSRVEWQFPVYAVLSADVKDSPAQSWAELAQSWAEKAENSATSSLQSANASADSATASATSATQSATSASEAQASAILANTYAQSAITAQEKAETAQTGAEQAQTSAKASADSALQSKDGAETAQVGAEQAEATAILQANIATEKASEANASLQKAKSQADRAETMSDNAQASANEASESATNAQTAQTNAEMAQSKAEQAQVGAEQAQSNAQARASEAQGFANDAQTSATASATSAGESATSSTNAQNSATSASESAIQSANSANEASSSATSAGTSATSAQTALEGAQEIKSELQGSLDQIDANTKQIAINTADIKVLQNANAKYVAGWFQVDGDSGKSTRADGYKKILLVCQENTVVDVITGYYNASGDWIDETGLQAGIKKRAWLSDWHNYVDERFATMTTEQQTNPANWLPKDFVDGEWDEPKWCANASGVLFEENTYDKLNILPFANIGFKTDALGNDNAVIKKYWIAKKYRQSMTLKALNEATGYVTKSCRISIPSGFVPANSFSVCGVEFTPDDFVVPQAFYRAEIADNDGVVHEAGWCDEIEIAAALPKGTWSYSNAGYHDYRTRGGWFDHIDAQNARARKSEGCYEMFDEYSWQALIDLLECEYGTLDVQSISYNQVESKSDCEPALNSYWGATYNFRPSHPSIVGYKADVSGCEISGYADIYQGAFNRKLKNDAYTTAYTTAIEAGDSAEVAHQAGLVAGDAVAEVVKGADKINMFTWRGIDVIWGVQLWNLAYEKVQFVAGETLPVDLMSAEFLQRLIDGGCCDEDGLVANTVYLVISRKRDVSPRAWKLARASDTATRDKVVNLCRTITTENDDGTTTTTLPTHELVPVIMPTTSGQWRASQAVNGVEYPSIQSGSDMNVATNVDYFYQGSVVSTNLAGGYHDHGGYAGSRYWNVGHVASRGGDPFLGGRFVFKSFGA